jgi:hypothetical protein
MVRKAISKQETANSRKRSEHETETETRESEIGIVIGDASGFAATQCGKAQPFRGGSILLFLRLSLRKKEGNGSRKAIGFPHCAAASRRRMVSASDNMGVGA